MIAGESAPFGDYLAWLKTLLRPRGVPTNSVALSVDLLAEYFRAQLSCERYSPIESVLEGGKKAFMDPSGIVGSFRTPTPEVHDPESVASLAKTLAMGEQEKAEAIIDSVSRENGYLGMAVRVVQPAMYRIGER